MDAQSRARDWQPPNIKSSFMDISGHCQGVSLSCANFTPPAFDFGYGSSSQLGATKRQTEFPLRAIMSHLGPFTSVLHRLAKI